MFIHSSVSNCISIGLMTVHVLKYRTVPVNVLDSVEFMNSTLLWTLLALAYMVNYLSFIKAVSSKDFKTRYTRQRVTVLTVSGYERCGLGMTLVVHDHQLMTKLCYFGMENRDPLASLLHDHQVRLYSLSLDCVATVALETLSRCMHMGVWYCVLLSSS